MNGNAINPRMYQALKTAQVVINELLFNAPDTYKAQQDMIQNALDTAEYEMWTERPEKGETGT